MNSKVPESHFCHCFVKASHKLVLTQGEMRGGIWGAVFATCLLQHEICHLGASWEWVSINTWKIEPNFILQSNPQRLHYYVWLSNEKILLFPLPRSCLGRGECQGSERISFLNQKQMFKCLYCTPTLGRTTQICVLLCTEERDRDMLPT